MRSNQLRGEKKKKMNFNLFDHAVQMICDNKEKYLFKKLLF